MIKKLPVKKKFLILILFLVSGVFSLSAEERVVRVAVFPARPLVYLEEGKPSGFFIELTEYFARELNWEIEYVPGTWGEALQRLEEGSVDLLPSVGYTRERDEIYNFNHHVIYIDSGVVFTGERFQPRTVFDLQGKRVAALENSIFTTGFLEYITSFGITCELIYTLDNESVMQAIADGKAEAGVCIYSLGNKLAEIYPVKVTPISFSPLALQFAVYGERNPDLIEGIDRLMYQMISDPDSFYNRSFQKWTAAPVKQRIPGWLWFGLAGLLLAGLGLFGLTILLKKKVNLKTRALEEVVRQKEGALLALDSEKKRLEITLRSIGDGVITTDGEGKILMLNKVAETLTGWNTSEAQGLPVSEIFIILDENTRVPAGNPVESVLVSGHTYELSQAFLISRPGEEHIIAYSCAPIKYQDARMIGTILVFSDISKTRRLNYQLQQSQKMEAVGTLAGGIAHDFNNILSSIIGYTELALIQQTEGSASIEFLSQVLGACERARDLTTRILAFSRHDKSVIKPLNLSQIVEDSLKMLRSVIPTSIEIRRFFDDSVPVISADSSQIHQVLLNLVTNSVNAMLDSGGVLGVHLFSTRITPETDSSFPDLPPGDYACITVEDTGKGIPPENLQKIFEPYFTTKDPGVGTGLGLYLVHDIVKTHSGYIHMESEPGKGTAVHLHFPLSSEDIEQGDSVVSDILPGRGERILFVDDEAAIVRVQKISLEQQGYQVTACTESREALSIFKADPGAFDLIITDMTMPGLTGDKLAEEVKSLRPEIPVILCTGYTEKYNQIRNNPSVDIMLMKPLGKSELAGPVRTLLDG